MNVGWFLEYAMTLHQLHRSYNVETYERMDLGQWGGQDLGGMRWDCGLHEVPLRRYPGVDEEISWNAIARADPFEIRTGCVPNTTLQLLMPLLVAPYYQYAVDPR